MSRLAIVTLQRQIHVLDAAGRERIELTTPMARFPTQGRTPWSMLQKGQEAWSWPTWSPSGKDIAAFAVETSDTETGPARVVTLSLDGVREVELAELDGGAPIYLQWEPQGRALSVLMQQGDELALALLRLDRLGTVRPLEQGVPLFMNWTEGGERLLLHVGRGDGGEGRLLVRDPLGTAEDVLLTGPPGTFCAPVFVDERVVYAVRTADGASRVVSSDLEGNDTHKLLQRRGLVAIVPGPKGMPVIAVSHAPRGEGTPYQGIDIVDVVTGGIRKISNAECMAFFWAPDGQWLLQAVVDADQNCLSWYRVPSTGGPPEALGSFWPTRDVLFYLHFFDQYASSHPIISADGEHIVFAGYPAGGGQADLSQPPRIWVRPVRAGAAEAIAEGNFAVWSPA